MNTERLTQITESIQSKLGENAGLIADDIGSLITENNSILESAKKTNDEIAKLRSEKESLLAVNGNLLKQIPMGYEEKEPEQEQVEKEINFRDFFDKNGKFKK